MTPEMLEQIPCVRAFMLADNELDRFDCAADLALLSPGLEDSECTEENRIPGCDSGLYYRLSLQDGRIVLITQSGSLLVKGLGAMLASVLAAYPAAEFSDSLVGLSDLLYARGLIEPERQKGLASLEAIVFSYAKKCQ